MNALGYVLAILVLAYLVYRFFRPHGPYTFQVIAPPCASVTKPYRGYALEITNPANTIVIVITPLADMAAYNLALRQVREAMAPAHLQDIPGTCKMEEVALRRWRGHCCHYTADGHQRLSYLLLLRDGDLQVSVDCFDDANTPTIKTDMETMIDTLQIARKG